MAIAHPQPLCLSLTSNPFFAADTFVITECYCGNRFENKGQVDDGECDYACSGDDLVACGGFNRINVFVLDDEEMVLVQPERENILGCFADGQGSRALNLEDVYELDDMTPEVRDVMGLLLRCSDFVVAQT